MDRKLKREQHPDIEEIIRRYKADNIDFSELEFEYESIKNENEEDLTIGVQAVLSAASLGNFE